MIPYFVSNENCVTLYFGILYPDVSLVGTSDIGNWDSNQTLNNTIANSKKVKVMLGFDRYCALLLHSIHRMRSYYKRLSNKHEYIYM